MKISKLFVGIIALSFGAAIAQAAPSSADAAGPAGPGCFCFENEAGGGACGLSTPCPAAPDCGPGLPACPSGQTCITNSCCGFTHCNDDCPAGAACANPAPCAGLTDCLEPPVPAVSEWGLLVLVLIGLTAGTVIFGRKRVAAH